MTISTVSGVSDRAYTNALKAKLRDPSRPIRLLDFLTAHEKEILLYSTIGLAYLDSWLEDLIKNISKV